MSWGEVADVINREFRNDESEYRTDAAYRKPYQQAKRYYESGVFSDFSEDDYLNELKNKKYELEKERKKLQTEKLEIRKFIREDARDELIAEKICSSIEGLKPLTIPKKIERTSNKKDYLLAFGDCHYGIEFQIEDIFGNIINEYSPEIFESRMWEMLAQVLEIVKEKGITEISVWELSDSTQGILRLNSQLKKLRYGVIESAMRYAEFLSQWLNKLSESVFVKFQMNKSGNHDQLRLCGAPKNAFPEENMGKIIWWFIKERLKDNPNIAFLEYGGDLNWGVFGTYSVCSIHGEVKDLEKALNDISRAQGTWIDYLIGAHCHHSSNKEVGIDSEVLSIRSIVGVDPYGMSLNKTSDAGASLFTFEQTKGLVCENKIKL